MDVGDEVDEEAEDENTAHYHKLLMPQLIISLDAGDEFLRQRVMNLPESVVVGTHSTEDALTRRLTDYRAVNTDDDTVLNYFDELEFHPEHIGQSPRGSHFYFCYLFPFLLSLLRFQGFSFGFKHRHRRWGSGWGGQSKKFPQNSGKKYFPGKYHVKFGHFFNFSCIFFGQKCLAPKVD